MGDGAECRIRSPRFARDDGSPRGVYAERSECTRDDSLLRYVAGFSMRWEYKETERDCRSRGARYS